MGERTIETIVSVTFEDFTNHRKFVLMMTTFKNAGWIQGSASGCKDKFEGIIYDCKSKLTGDAESIKKNYGKDIEFVSKIKSLTDVKKVISTVHGSWLENCIIDKTVYWDVEKDLPPR